MCFSVKVLRVIFYLFTVSIYFPWLGFSWTDGKPLSFVNWYANEPYPLNRHLCAGMNNGGKWQDEPCYLRYPSVCKLPLGKLILLLNVVNYTYFVQEYYKLRLRKK